MPGLGRPWTTMVPTATVKAMDQNTSWKAMRRREYHAASGRVNIRERTRTGWTTSSVPKPRAMICRP